MSDAATISANPAVPRSLAEAIALPSGARWVRVALQINPFAYVGANAPSRSFADEAAYNAALIAELKSLDIELIAITDHWSVETALGLIASCKAAGIHALPGFEANTGEGVHLLVIFDSGTSIGDVNAAIGACGVTPGCLSGTIGSPFADIVTTMTERGALVVAPHVNTPSGLMTTLSGQALAKNWRHESLHAVAVSPGQPVEANHQLIFDNKVAEFERAHPVAVLHADDVCNPSRLRQVGATSWVKMSRPSLESLRVAVRTPETRVRTTDPLSIAHGQIRAVAWEGGFLDGMRVHFNESLTTLIGGRGTGKSTIVESIRFALDLPPIGEKAQADYASFQQKVLRGGAKVSVLIEAVEPARQEFIIERTVPHPPIVRDVAGAVLAQKPLDVLGPVEIFSQHELAELAEDKTYVAKMLERFAGLDEDAGRQREVTEALADNRNAQLETAGRLDKLAARLDELPRLREQVAQYVAAGIDSRLQEQEHLQSEDGLLKTATARLASIDDALVSLRAPTLLESSFTNAAVRGGLPRGEMLSEAETIMAELREALNGHIAAIETSTRQSQDKLAALRDRWTAATNDVRDQYDEVVRILSAAGLDATRYLAVTRRVAALEADLPQRQQMEDEQNRLRGERLQLLAERTELDGRARRRLNKAATAANELVKGFVVVKPTASRNRADLEKLITQHVSGQRTQIIAAVNREDFSPQAFAAACRTDATTLTDTYGIRGAQAESLLRSGEALYLELEEHVIGLAAEAQLNVATTGSRYKSLDDLSKGQKATALLLLLLTSAVSPLIIDQPEDNLDNRFVFDGVVRRLRGLKGTRQLILSTHNANVPVLGDAELVVAMESEGDLGRIATGGLGSIDDEPVRLLASELLEGGREAFDARRYLYGY